MGKRRDPIAVVEACYDLGGSEEAWLQGLAEAAFPLVRPVGIIGYHVTLDERGPRIHSPVQVGASEDAFTKMRTMAALLERHRAGTAGLLDRVQARLYARVVTNGMLEPADVLLVSEAERLGPRWMYTLGASGVQEVFHLRSNNIDGLGATVLAAGLPDERKFSASERVMFQMISAHIKAGFRLRRRLTKSAPGVELPEHGAVLDASFRVLDAEGDAKDASAREALACMAREIDRARTQAGGRDEAALAVWQGLVDGRWSLVEHFDADGKRFMLAHRNPEGVRDPRGLSSMERRVAALAARGYSNKLIGYHLGIPEGTASSHLARAMLKLKFESRVELVRTLGSRHSMPAPTEFVDEQEDD